MSNIRLGEALMQAGLIDKYQLQSALGQQKRWGGRIGKALIDLGFIDEGTLIKFLSEQLKFSAVDLSRSKIAAKTFQAVPKRVAEKYMVVPVVIRDTTPKKTLVLAMMDPTDLKIIDEIEFVTNYKIEPVVALETGILNMLKHYGQETSPSAEPEERIAVDDNESDRVVIMHGARAQMEAVQKEYGAPKDEDSSEYEEAHVEGENEFDLGARFEESGSSAPIHDLGTADEDDSPIEMDAEEAATAAEAEPEQDADIIEDVEPMEEIHHPEAHIEEAELEEASAEFTPAESPENSEEFFGEGEPAESAAAHLEQDALEAGTADEYSGAAQLLDTQPVEEATEFSGEAGEYESAVEAEAVAEPVAEEAPPPDESTGDIPVSVTHESVQKAVASEKAAVREFWNTEPAAVAVAEEAHEADEVFGEAEPIHDAVEAEAAQEVEASSEVETAPEVEAEAAQAVEAETVPAVEAEAAHAVEAEATDEFEAEPVSESDLSNQIAALRRELDGMKQKIESFIMLFILKEQGKMTLQEFLAEVRKI